MKIKIAKKKDPLGIDPAVAGRFAAGGALAGGALAAALNFAQMIRELNEKRRQNRLSEDDIGRGILTLTLPGQNKIADDLAEKGVNDLTAGDNEDYEDDAEHPEEGVQGASYKEPVEVEKVTTEKSLTRELAVSNDKEAKAVDEELGVMPEDMPLHGNYHKSPDKAEAGVRGSDNEPIGKKPKIDKLRFTMHESTRHQPRRYDGTLSGKTRPLHPLKYDGQQDALKKNANWQTLTASLLAMGAGGMLGYSLVDKIHDIRRVKQKEQEHEQARREYMDLLKKEPDEKSAEQPAFMDVFDKEAKKTFTVLDYPLGIAALSLILGTGGSAYITKRILDEMEDGGSAPAKQPEVRRIVFRTDEGAPADKEASDKNSLVATAALGVFLDLCSGQANVLDNEKVAEHGKPAKLYKMATENFDNFMQFLEANEGLCRSIKESTVNTHPVVNYFNQEKEASLFDPTGVMTSLYGSTLAAQLISKNKAKEEAEPGAEKKEPVEDKAKRVQEIMQNLEIAAADPEAADFIRNNADRIRALLQQMAAQGKL
jgi:hypothetical protein